MDFNPLDILATAALGEKDAPSDVKTSAGGETSGSGQADNSESADSKDADEDSDKEMGKTTSNSLKHSSSDKDTEKMAPQKMPWSPDTLVSDHLERMSGKQDKFPLDDLVQDIKKKEIDAELKKIIDENVTKDICPKEKCDEEFVNKDEINIRVNSDMVSNNNNLNNLHELESASQTSEPSSDCENTKENGVNVQDSTWQDESGSSPSEDTMDSNDSKLPDSVEPSSYLCSQESVILDHPYAVIQGKAHPQAFFEEDDDIDVCSDNSPLSEDSEHRSNNLSLDCSYLKFGIMEGVSANTLDLYKKSRSTVSRFKLPSSSSSASSPTADLAVRPVPSNFDEAGDIFTGIGSPAPPSSDLTSAHSQSKPSLKYGKFKIGTFASFSSSNLELETFLKSRDHFGNKKLNIGIPGDTRLVNSSLNSPSSYPNIHPLLQSPSQDWDRSEAGSETQDDSSDARTPLRMSPDFTEKVTEWSHPVFHDHDYCAKDSKPVSCGDDIRKFSSGKRKYIKKKNKLDGLNHEKILKGKYLKKELLRQDSFMKATAEMETSADAAVIKTNPVGRPRKRPFEKIIDEIDPEVGSKLKITGKFKDQYVYYLSKSSRTTTRRRQAPVPPFTLDKIIVPAPKPGDIVVPHLSDADIETVRLKGRGALNLPARPHMTNHLSLPSMLPTSSVTGEYISDVDSHIVSTILSMENDSLSSPTASQAPDITNTVGLNPNQPELTESLRLMSGDPSITSEHVLNYLLSVVKEDGLLGSGSGFDAGSSALFPSLQPDGICTKVDHTGDAVAQDLSSLGSLGSPNGVSGHSLLDITKPVQSSHSFDNHTVLTAPHIHGPDHFLHAVHKDSQDENVSLPDDLSSFMSNSQGTSSSSNTTQDGDSHSSLKSMFGSDLSSLGTPQLSSSVPRLTSIEKTLDYLGVRDDDIKLDDSVFSTKMDHDTDSTQALTPVSSTSSDDTPWIVTVTLYFNDVPAIMINNQPYIRLVDIHKQILPAKDTGILKKRCQLLKIPVLNCTEMQRYFLVQYGRAYNSKSTLIVSKEQATNLVTYYAIPQPRIGRTDEGHQRRPSSSAGSEEGTRSPVSQLAPGSYKKRGSKSFRRNTVSLGSPDPDIFGLLESQPLQQVITMKCETLPLLHGKRTRHKKINYLEMLKGEEKNRSSDAAILETIESVVKSIPDYVVQEGKKNKTPVKKKVKGDLINSNRSRAGKRKFPSWIQKNNDKGSKIKKSHLGLVQRAKSNKTKSGTSEKQLMDKDIDVCSEADTDDSVDLSQSKKFRPLKLKVNSLLNFAGPRKGSSSSKKGLFSCRNSSTSPGAERPLRVLAVAHQAALSGSNIESHLPSQPADIHLDLFIKSNSACVRCETCSQFLSVPHFMRHHHVPMDSEWLATEAAHRILVPRNKENISEQEKRLWEEFHHLQEAIGGFGEADDETDSEDDAVDYGDEEDDDHVSLQLSETLTSMLSAGRPQLCIEAQLKDHCIARLSSCESPSLTQENDGREGFLKAGNQPVPVPSTISDMNSGDTLAKVGLVHRDMETGALPAAELHSRVASSNTSSSLRTSSRKRKSKQLFSIENYYVPHRSSVDEESNSHKESI